MTATSNAGIKVTNDRGVQEEHAALMHAVVHEHGGRHSARSAQEIAPLDAVLNTVRFTGAAYFDVGAREPWSIRSPARESMLPRILPGADHLIACHVVMAGSCFVSLDGGEAVPLEAGDAVVFANADPHTLSSTAGMRAAAPATDMIAVADAGPPPFQINLGKSGVASARPVCGYLACDAKPFNPLLQTLPPMLKASGLRRNDIGWLGRFIRFAMAEVTERRGGSQSIPGSAK